MASSSGFRQLPRPVSPPGSPHRAAPSSPQRRRQFFEHSEEAAGERSIEDFIYLSDPYRSTSIRPRIPLPMMPRREPPELRNLLYGEDRSPTGLCKEIQEILKGHQLVAGSIQLKTLTKPGYIDARFITLVVEINMELAETFENLSAARRAVRSLLQERTSDINDLDIHVEILDPNRTYQPGLFPISPDDIFIELYESFRNSLVVDVEEALRTSWSSMCIYRLGNHSQHSVYAITIMVLPFTVFDWQNFQRRLKDKYIRHLPKPGDEIEIHFIPGRVVLGGDRAPGKDLAKFQENLQPKIGCSIGIDGEWGGGTLGAFMSMQVLEKDENNSSSSRIVRGFITASHVVQPRKTAGEAVNLSFNQEGVDWTVPPSDPKRPTVRYPSQADYEATKENIEAMIESNAAELELSRQKIEQAKEIGHDTRINRLEEISKLQEKNKIWLRDYQIQCHALPMQLGRTFWASGRAYDILTKGTIDFAFVELSHATPAVLEICARGNRLPEPTAFAGHTPDDDLSSYPKVKTWNLPYPEFMTHAFGEILEGQWYHKTGRSTRVTSGICHGTEAFCRMTEVEERKKMSYDPSGIPGEYKYHGYTTEKIIIRSKEFSPGSSLQGDMQILGDSGCVMIDWAGCPSGVGFGSIVGQCGPYGHEETNSNPLGNYYGASVSIVTSMPVIQRHLRQRANAELGFW